MAYKNDLKDGTWENYYESGELKLKKEYKDGKEHGTFIEYRKDIIEIANPEIHEINFKMDSSIEDEV